VIVAAQQFRCNNNKKTMAIPAALKKTPSVGWVERLRNPSPPSAWRCRRWVSPRFRGDQPILRSERRHPGAILKFQFTE
jgi:hypothetical protein